MNGQQILLPVMKIRLFNYGPIITCFQGSVLIWDQTVMHGTAPNFSEHCRLAQYIKAYSRKKVFGESFTSNARLHRRSASLRSLLERDSAYIDDIGFALFGLDILNSEITDNACL